MSVQRNLVGLRAVLAVVMTISSLSLAMAQSPPERYPRSGDDEADVRRDEIPEPARSEPEMIDPGAEMENDEEASPSDIPASDRNAAAPLAPLPITPLPPPPKIWSGNVELGLNGTEGNQETFNIRLGGKATAKYAWSTQTYEAIVIDNTSSGVTIARNAISDARWEIPLWSPVWSYYAHGRLEYDEFKPFDIRVAGDTGLGYDWIKTDVNYFQTRSGISTSREFGGAEDFWKPELAFGLEWRYTIDARQKITLKSDYFPTWDDFSDYRLNTQADWEFAIHPAWNLSLKLSAISRYDATPNGAKPHDLNYSALVLWNY